MNFLPMYDHVSYYPTIPIILFGISVNTMQLKDASMQLQIVVQYVQTNVIFMLYSRAIQLVFPPDRFEKI